MKSGMFGPRLRAGVLRWGMALLGGAILTGCQTPPESLQQLAYEQNRRLQRLQSGEFPLAVLEPLQRLEGERLRVYLEGDGHAWATASQPSLDPSPENLLVARLAANDPQPSVYLARPCQFYRAAPCKPSLWTDQRYSPQVLASLDRALDLLKTRYGNREFELIGYSGGAALALLLAATRDDVTEVQTLAGNLSPRLWAQLRELTPLAGSLEPLDYRQRLSRLPQRHLVGLDDTIVPADLSRRYYRALGTAQCLSIIDLPGVTHDRGWEDAWRQWREWPLRCEPPRR